MNRIGTFMGLPLFESREITAEGFAFVSVLKEERPDAEYHIVMWHPLNGVSEQRIRVDVLRALTDALSNPSPGREG